MSNATRTEQDQPLNPVIKEDEAAKILKQSKAAQERADNAKAQRKQKQRKQKVPHAMSQLLRDVRYVAAQRGMGPHDLSAQTGVTPQQCSRVLRCALKRVQTPNEKKLRDWLAKPRNADILKARGRQAPNPDSTVSTVETKPVQQVGAEARHIRKQIDDLRKELAFPANTTMPLGDLLSERDLLVRLKHITEQWGAESRKREAKQKAMDDYEALVAKQRDIITALEDEVNRKDQAIQSYRQHAANPVASQSEDQHLIEALRGRVAALEALVASYLSEHDL